MNHEGEKNKEVNYCGRLLLIYAVADLMIDKT